METREQSVGIIGVGVIGSSWAAFYAGKGLKVKMYDADRLNGEIGFARAKDYITFLRTREVISEDAASKGISNMNLVGELVEAVKDVQVVQECVAERYDAKQKVFQIIDAESSKDVILASSSSGLLMTEIQKVTHSPERCLIAHPFNPPHLIPLVELVPGERTDDQTVLKMRSFLEGLGKIPVILKKEVPGHIANRLSAAIWREAIDLVLEGIASVEDVDKALFAGPGLRWSFMGQHLIYHLGGGDGGIGHFIDHLGSAFEDWWKDMATWKTLPAEARTLLMEGIAKELGDKNAKDLVRWRDDKLVKLLRAIYE